MRARASINDLSKRLGMIEAGHQEAQPPGAHERRFKQPSISIPDGR